MGANADTYAMSRMAATLNLSREANIFESIIIYERRGREEYHFNYRRLRSSRLCSSIAMQWWQVFVLLAHCEKESKNLSLSFGKSA